MKTEIIQNHYAPNCETNGHDCHTNGANGSRLSHLEPETLNLEPTHTRNGKIARLPHELRELVNLRLRNGARYATIVAELAEKGHPGITIHNISHWKHGGYVDWLQQQQRLEARLALPQALERCTRGTKFNHLQQNAIAFAAEHLSLIMLEFDYRRALDALYRKPELFPSFVAAISKLARSTTELAKTFDILQPHENRLRRQLNLSPSQLPVTNCELPMTNPDHCEHSQTPKNGNGVLPSPEGRGTEGEAEGTIQTTDDSREVAALRQPQLPITNCSPLSSLIEPNRTDSHQIAPPKSHLEFALHRSAQCKIQTNSGLPPKQH